jgi:hypothetical protein
VSLLACGNDTALDPDTSSDSSDGGAAGEQGDDSSGSTKSTTASDSTSADSTSSTSSGGSGGADTDGATATGGSGGDSTESDGAGGETSTTADDTTTGGDQTCSFDVNYELSSAIATVGIVTWSTDLEAIDEAQIEFGLTGGDFSMEAPVDLSEPDYRTLLLGMKGDRDYSFRIVASAGDQTCTSEIYSLTTGPVSNSVPTLTRTVQNEAAIAPGFILTASGLGGGRGGSASMAFILDSDGDVVWWAEAPQGAGRAQLNWEGTDMWMSSVNNGGGHGEVRRVSLDGLDVEANVEGLENAHHDFTVLPGGVIATIAYRTGSAAACSTILERAADGSITPIVENVSTLYKPAAECHPNAIHYYAADDSFTLSDRNPNLFVKFTHAGELEWQFGGENPMGPHYPGTWSVNHGHQLLKNGNFLFFNNGQARASSLAREFHLNGSSMTATEVWSYESMFQSGTLGDVQRLPNGNTLIVYSNSGVIHEVDLEGNLVQQIQTGSLGYADHRPTLYGPPSR